jgi:glycosyltransferase involved in cell wall biosynthesis
VVEREGEQYRDRLLALRRELGLQAQVMFDDRYLTPLQLAQVIREADVVLLPYDSDEQVTSGVLTEAVAAGKPVISTSFPHAVELLSGGAGILVPRRDPHAMADALAHVLGDERVARAMSLEARRLAVDLMWPAVAARYVELARTVARRPQHRRSPDVVLPREAPQLSAAV